MGLDAAEGGAVFVLVPPQAPSRRATKAAVTKRAPGVWETLAIENLQFVVLPRSRGLSLNTSRATLRFTVGS